MHAFPSLASMVLRSQYMAVMDRLEIAMCEDETAKRQQTNAQTDKANHSGGEDC